MQWNNSLRKFFKHKVHKNAGQKQSIAFFKNLGINTDVKIDNKEFVNYKWIKANELKTTIHPERSSLTNMVAEDLKEILKNANI